MRVGVDGRLMSTFQYDSIKDLTTLIAKRQLSSSFSYLVNALGETQHCTLCIKFFHASSITTQLIAPIIHLQLCITEI